MMLDYSTIYVAMYLNTHTHMYNYAEYQDGLATDDFKKHVIIQCSQPNYNNAYACT